VNEAWHAATQTHLEHIETELLEDREWERAWMDDFRPERFGEHLWICPSWQEPPDPGRSTLILDPGLAFGSGTHPQPDCASNGWIRPMLRAPTSLTTAVVPESWDWRP